MGGGGLKKLETSLIFILPNPFQCYLLSLSVWCVYVSILFTYTSITYISKKPHYVSNLSKHDALSHRIYIKVLLVLRHQGSTCVDPYH